MPTFVEEKETAWNTATTPKLVSQGFNVNDVLISVFAEEGFTTGETLSVSDARAIPNEWSNYPHDLMIAGGTCYVGMAFLYPATYSEAGMAISLNRSGGTAGFCGMNVLRFSNCDDVGYPQSDGDQSSSFSTTYDNSALVTIVADWGARDVTFRDWSTPTGGTPWTEITYFNDSQRYTVAAAYTPDAGPAGIKSIGFTSSPYMDIPRMMTIEIYNKAGGGTPPAVGPLLTEAGLPLLSEAGGLIAT